MSLRGAGERRGDHDHREQEPKAVARFRHVQRDARQDEEQVGARHRHAEQAQRVLGHDRGQLLQWQREGGQHAVRERRHEHEKADGPRRNK